MILRLLLAALAALGLATAAAAEPTPVMVRAISKDAKFIGDSMGGVKIVLTDARSGAVLAEGLTTGGTGDTDRLIVNPRVRRAPLATPDAAGFLATLDIDAPTLVRAEANGPIGKPWAQATVTSTMWILPGKAVTGDGWVLELPGLVVEPAWTALGNGQASLSAKVTLMCGCPITPGGHWDAARYDVRATLTMAGRTVQSAKLDYAGAASTFGVAFPKLAPGVYRLLVTAHDAGSGNTGVVERDVEVN